MEENQGRPRSPHGMVQLHEALTRLSEDSLRRAEEVSRALLTPPTNLSKTLRALEGLSRAPAFTLPKLDLSPLHALKGWDGWLEGTTPPANLAFVAGLSESQVSVVGALQEELAGIFASSRGVADSLNDQLHALSVAYRDQLAESVANWGGIAAAAASLTEAVQWTDEERADRLRRLASEPEEVAALIEEEPTALTILFTWVVTALAALDLKLTPVQVLTIVIALVSSHNTTKRIHLVEAEVRANGERIERLQDSTQAEHTEVLEALRSIQEELAADSACAAPPEPGDRPHNAPAEGRGGNR